MLQATLAVPYNPPLKIQSKDSSWEKIHVHRDQFLVTGNGTKAWTGNKGEEIAFQSLGVLGEGWKNIGGEMKEG